MSHLHLDPALWLYDIGRYYTNGFLKIQPIIKYNKPNLYTKKLIFLSKHKGHLFICVDEKKISLSLSLTRQNFIICIYLNTTLSVNIRQALYIYIYSLS